MTISYKKYIEWQGTAAVYLVIGAINNTEDVQSQEHHRPTLLGYI